MCFIYIYTYVYVYIYIYIYTYNISTENIPNILIIFLQKKTLQMQYIKFSDQIHHGLINCHVYSNWKFLHRFSVSIQQRCKLILIL